MRETHIMRHIREVIPIQPIIGFTNIKSMSYITLINFHFTYEQFQWLSLHYRE